MNAKNADFASRQARTNQDPQKSNQNNLNNQSNQGNRNSSTQVNRQPRNSYNERTLRNERVSYNVRPSRSVHLSRNVHPSNDVYSSSEVHPSNEVRPSRNVRTTHNTHPSRNERTLRNQWTSQYDRPLQSEYSSRNERASWSDQPLRNDRASHRERPLRSERTMRSDRPMRSNRTLRSQDYLLSRDEEIVDRPSAGYRRPTEGAGTTSANRQHYAGEEYRDHHAEFSHEQYDEVPRGVRGVAARVAGKLPFGRRGAGSSAATATFGVGDAAAAPHDARKLGKSYMPGLDGLRALAVLAVLLYHISPNQFIGGYIGVDLFFVISGFLITYRNLQNIQNPNKTFTLKNFWLRRARRLIPALVLVILVCVPIGAIIYPDILVGAFRQVAGALTYSTNWVEIIHGSNYFDQANPSLFKNFWSLAVEEQFYIIWPPLLLLLLSRRLKNSQLVTIVATIAVASMVLMGVLAAPDNYTRVYYGTDTHCFGLAMGIIFAFIWNKEKGSLSKEWLSAQPWIPALAPVGLIGFILIVMLVPDTAAFTYPFGLVLGSLFSLFLVGAVIIRPDTLFTRIMELAPLRWLGVRSYGIYLWHWPMLVFGRILIPTAMGTVENVAVDVLFALISFVASDLSYRFIEEPMRKDGFIKSLEKLVDRVREGIVGKIQAAVCVVLVLATIIAIATAPAKTQLQLQIEQQQAEQAQQAQEAQQNAGNGSQQDPGSIPNYDESQMTGIPDSSTITAIGDSLISGNSIGFEEEFPEINFLAEPIRQWEQGVEVVKEGNNQGLIRQNVILDFGTNGGVSDEALVRQVIDELGPNRRILLYNIYSPSSFVDEANAIYEKIAEEYPNVYLVDWNSVAAAHPEYLNSDRTHTNIEGQNAFVDAAKSVFSES